MDLAAVDGRGLQPPAFGGQGLPSIGAACTEMLNSASMSFALCPLLPALDMLARQKIDTALLSTKISTPHFYTIRILSNVPGLRDIVIKGNESTLACEPF